MTVAESGFRLQGILLRVFDRVAIGSPFAMSRRIATRECNRSRATSQEDAARCHEQNASAPRGVHGPGRIVKWVPDEPVILAPAAITRCALQPVRIVSSLLSSIARMRLKAISVIDRVCGTRARAMRPHSSISS